MAAMVGPGFRNNRITFSLAGAPGKSRLNHPTCFKPTAAHNHFCHATKCQASDALALRRAEAAQQPSYKDNRVCPGIDGLAETAKDGIITGRILVNRGREK